MNWTLTLVAMLTVAFGLGAVALRNLIHCALSLVAMMIGLALIYFGLDAQFIALAQLLVYVGAVAVLIVFAVILTRGGAPESPTRRGALPVFGVAAAVLGFGALVVAVLGTTALEPNALPGWDSQGAVRGLGVRLMTDYVLVLEGVGLLLTAALIGAVLVALREPRERP